MKYDYNKLIGKYCNWRRGFFMFFKDKFITGILMILLIVSIYIMYTEYLYPHKNGIALHEVLTDSASLVPNEESEHIEALEHSQNSFAIPSLQDSEYELVSAFFAQAKLEREQVRGQKKEWYSEIINNRNMDDDKRSEAVDQLLNLQQQLEQETATEALLQAKGFEQVYVYIDDGIVDVVVSNADLSEEQFAQIEDIITRKTGIPVHHVKITPYQP
jgi:stage III sporulation protein AH